MKACDIDLYPAPRSPISSLAIQKALLEILSQGFSYILFVHNAAQRGERLKNGEGADQSSHARVGQRTRGSRR